MIAVNKHTGLRGFTFCIIRKSVTRKFKLTDNLVYLIYAVHIMYIVYRADTRGKTGKTSVLYRFWEVDHSRGCGMQVMWRSQLGSCLIKIYCDGPDTYDFNTDLITGPLVFKSKTFTHVKVLLKSSNFSQHNFSRRRKKTKLL